MLYVLLLGLVLLVAWQMVLPRVGLVSVAPQELQARLQAGEKLVIVDVREPWEYAQGHIRGAQLLPLGALPQAAASLPREATIVLVCRSGNRSARAFQILKRQGFPHLLNLRGGMLAWPGPVVTG